LILGEFVFVGHVLDEFVLGEFVLGEYDEEK